MLQNSSYTSHLAINFLHPFSLQTAHTIQQGYVLNKYVYIHVNFSQKHTSIAFYHCLQTSGWFSNSFCNCPQLEVSTIYTTPPPFRFYHLGIRSALPIELRYLIPEKMANTSTLFSISSTGNVSCEGCMSITFKTCKLLIDFSPNVNEILGNCSILNENVHF